MSDSKRARLYRPSEMAQDNPLPRLKRRQVRGDHAMINQLELAKDFSIARHEHPNEQIVVLLEGRLQAEIDLPEGGSEALTMNAGEILHLPGHVGHAFIALEDSIVLDIFSPPGDSTGIDQFRDDPDRS